MNEQHDNRSPEEIQREIERTRAEMSDTIGTLRQKLSPGELFDQALDAFKGGSGEFSSNLVTTVKENPLPVALIGAGIAWLMMGGTNRTSTSSHWEPTDYRRGPVDPVYPRTSGTSAQPRTSGSTGSTMEGIRDKAGAARDRIGEAASGARERINAAGEHISSMASSAQERVGGAASSVQDSVANVASNAQQGMQDAADHWRYQTRRQSAQVREKFDYMRENQPLVLGALGFAVGAALGAGLPATQREDELLGETRDEMMQRAREVGEEQLDKAKQVAAAATEAAKEHADREGLTQHEVDKAVRSTGEKIERVVEAAGEAAKEEANKQGVISPKK